MIAYESDVTKQSVAFYDKLIDFYSNAKVSDNLNLYIFNNNSSFFSHQSSFVALATQLYFISYHYSFVALATQH